MGLKSKINWTRARKRFKQFLLALAVFIICIATIALASDDEPETSILFLVPAAMFLGYAFGNYVSRIFLKQTIKYQLTALVSLPILSFIASVIMVSIASDDGRRSPFEIFFLVLSTLVLGLSIGVFASLFYNKLRQQINKAETAAAHSKSEFSPKPALNCMAFCTGIWGNKIDRDRVHNSLCRCSMDASFCSDVRRFYSRLQGISLHAHNKALRLAEMRIPFAL